MIRHPRSQAGRLAENASRRIRGRLVVLAGAALLALGAQPVGSAGAQSESGEVFSTTVHQRPGDVRDYWTQARIRRAKPADRLVRGLEPATHPVRGERGEPKLVSPAAPGVSDAAGGLGPGLLGSGDAERRARASDLSGSSTRFPQRTHGKVYFTVRGGSDPGNYQCSGTAIRSPSHTLAFTAGHCVFDSQFGGGTATNWVFIPGFRDGQRPFGTWVARSLHTTAGWRDNEDERFDAGAATLARDSEGRGVQDVVGARGIAFNQPRDQRYGAFGYPAEGAFDGGRLHYCSSPYLGDDTEQQPPRPIRIRCDMTGGASGGGWVVGGRHVVSLTSYGYECDSSIIIIRPCSNPERGNLFGPYFGRSIEKLYRRARGTALKCARAEVTNLGGDGRDDYSGTRRHESFKMRGGPDTASGGRGADRLCGGRGRDRLEGGGGRDILRGGRGKDVLVGGKGRDVCVGGKGRDRAFGCEVRKRIRR